VSEISASGSFVAGRYAGRLLISGGNIYTLTVRENVLKYLASSKLVKTDIVPFFLIVKVCRLLE
jgi:hypothetical protein